MMQWKMLISYDMTTESCFTWRRRNKWRLLWRWGKGWSCEVCRKPRSICRQPVSHWCSGNCPFRLATDALRLCHLGQGCSTSRRPLFSTTAYFAKYPSSCHRRSPSRRVGSRFYFAVVKLTAMLLSSTIAHRCSTPFDDVFLRNSITADNANSRAVPRLRDGGTAAAAAMKKRKKDKVSGRAGFARISPNDSSAAWRNFAGLFVIQILPFFIYYFFL